MKLLQYCIIICSGVTAGGGHFSLGNFCWPTGKRKARENGEEKKENRKREREGGKWKGKMRGVFLLFSFFFFFFFFFPPFHWNFFWIYQNENFLLGKNQEKWLPLLKSIPLTPLIIWLSGDDFTFSVIQWWNHWYDSWNRQWFHKCQIYYDFYVMW